MHTRIAARAQYRGAVPVRRPLVNPVTLLVVIVGGMLGVAARAALTLPIPANAHPLAVPGVTLGINLAGSFLLGVVVGRLHDRPRLRAFVGTGIISGFTTYSAFAVQMVQVSTAAPLVGIALAAVSVLGGVAVAALGLRVGRGDRPGEVEPPEDAE